MARDVDDEREDRQVKMSFGRETADVQAAAKNVDPEALDLFAEALGMKKDKDGKKKA